MYTEKIDNTLASALLGSDYQEGLSYVLYSDRDKFTITGYDNEGNRSLEVELEKDVGESDDSSYEEEEESLTPAPSKRIIPIGSIIAIIMLFVCVASITAVVMFLSERG